MSPWLLSLALAADWRDAMATGDCATVVSSLPAPVVAVEQLALARCLEERGDDGRAIEVAAGITDKNLLPYARVVRARALLDRERPEEAVAALDGVSMPGSDDELLRGKALVLARRSLEARDGLRALLEVAAVAPEARFWLAVGAEDRGERDAAISAYRATWTRHPMSPWASRAGDRLAALGAKVADYDTAEGRALVLERAKSLIAQKQAPEALPMLDAIAARDPFDTPDEARWLADALFDGKSYARARDAYAALPGTRDSPHHFFQYALATARAGDYDAAAVLYRELVARHPGSSQADEASFKPGYMDHDAGELDAAISGFRTYLSKYPSGKFASDARWFMAWDLHRLGRDIEAINEMDLLTGAYPQVDIAIAARYWRARLKGDDTGLEQVIKLYPESSYAWFAAQRLGTKYPAAPPATAPTLDKGWVAARPGLATGILLVESGMADWGRPLLAAHRDAAKGSASTAVPFALLLVKAEDYAGAKSLGCPHRASPGGLDACLPRPHRGTVDAIARQHGLDPLLPYAIMNAESGLDPRVTSPAGAMGLMQLMPRLAEDLARDRLPGFFAEQLYRAGVNARLGTTELGLLQAGFARSAVSPSLPLVIAGYNGGRAAVERWLAAYPTPPQADEFAENVSYTETRRYVRRVLGYLQQYRRAYGDQ